MQKQFEKSTFDSTEGGPARLIISEPGLYKVIQTSRKPAAKRGQVHK
jgi:prophage antirepressor-like protein